MAGCGDVEGESQVFSRTFRDCWRRSETRGRPFDASCRFPSSVSLASAVASFEAYAWSRLWRDGVYRERAYGERV
jgi:hypothetical protein